MKQNYFSWGGLQNTALSKVRNGYSEGVLDVLYTIIAYFRAKFYVEDVSHLFRTVNIRTEMGRRELINCLGLFISIEMKLLPASTQKASEDRRCVRVVLPDWGRAGGRGCSLL
jgi:hypothetical protein